MTDPHARLATYAFRVSLGGEIAGFSAVSGLAMARGTVSSAAPVRLTLRRGIVPTRGALFAWLNGDAEVRTLDICLLDAEGRPAATWRAARAVPVKLTAPCFDTNADMAAIEEVELLAIGLRPDTAA